MFSNRYIFTFSVIMVVIVATILALLATALQPFQEQNIRIEKMQYILNSAHIENDVENAESLYDQHVVMEYVIDEQGNILETYSADNTDVTERGFDINLKEQMTQFDKTSAAHFPVFVIAKGSDTLYSLPVRGKGLWGPIWGYIALKNDFNTIEGAVFDHKGETPGLGAEINTKPFQDQFIGKQIFDENGEFVSVAIVKGGVANSKIPEIHGVDAISGGTITSDGTSDMIRDGLNYYLPFISKQQSHE
ncbi:MAG: NADH:ubiquinone reductase (Na(+)-transporting) subunit C [Marinilabiliales bacterium]|nr:MAG: NADH:ubiquinone reductase (Na(+)-transporting) subunit C [Marinilabiliales bacterium]